MTETDRERLARYVRERREELGLTQEDAATSGGPSTATIRLIENASPVTPRPKSLRQLENALDWEPGSVRTILRGGEPAARIAARPLRHFSDPRLEAIWAITELPEEVRKGLIRFAEGYLADCDDRRAG